MKKVFIGFMVLVFAEMAALILVGNAIGLFPTLLLIILTSVLGVMVAKKKGIKSFKTIQDSVAQGQPPGVAMIDTFMVFLGGMLLVIPGFITDLIGLLLVTGFTRKLFKPVIFFWLRKKMKQEKVIIVQR